MCESNAFVVRDGKDELIMESVGSLVPGGGKIALKSIFGETLYVEGALIEIDLVGHKIRLKEKIR